MCRYCCCNHHPAIDHRHRQFTRPPINGVAFQQWSQPVGPVDHRRRQVGSLRGDRSHLSTQSYLEWLLGDA